MDIDALLSPDRDGDANQASRDTSASSSPSPRNPRSRPGAGQRSTSGLSQEVMRSPERITSNPSSRPASAHGSPHSATTVPISQLPTIAEYGSGFRPATSHQAPTSFPTSTVDANSMHDGASRVEQIQKRLSTAQIDTPADPASVQARHSMSRSNSSSGIHRLDYGEAQRSPSLMQQSNPYPIMRNHSGQSLADLTMAEGPSQTPPPRSINTTTLTNEESQLVTELLSYLTEHSYAYTSHVQLINLLHKGFLAHVHDRPDQDPNSYDMLGELRQAREAMDSRFAVGEDILVDWLSDEAILARSADDAITVTELFQKAVQDEPASIKVWQAYLHWIESNYASTHGLEGARRAPWSDEDRELCRDLFTKDLLLDALEQAAEATRWRLDESHLIWNQWAAQKHRDLDESFNELDYLHLREAFLQRYEIPHLGFEQTRSLFWPVVQKWDEKNWEIVMASANDTAKSAQKQAARREPCERELQKALESGDTNAIIREFQSYLVWEKTQKQHNAFGFDLKCGLYERALLRFPTATEWWLEYIDFVIANNPTASAIPLIERATRHCPWSGDLWGMRILRSDVESKPYADIEAAKHRATNSGLLDVGGVEELLKVLQQWCSYLRRHAFKFDSTEDDVLTAQIGTTAALEDVQQAARHQADNFLYPLQNIQIKFFTEARSFPQAREIYRKLAAIHGHSAEFWARYYNWELWLWGYERLSEARRIETMENGPHLATEVVQNALLQNNLDSPERVLDMYLNHFQLHESGVKLESALIRAREFSKRLALRREREANVKDVNAAGAAVSEARPLEGAIDSFTATATNEHGYSTKRKADNAEVGSSGYKRTKTEHEVAHNAGDDESMSTSAHSKRDREHNTVALRNLPAGVQELDIKKFFRDVGLPLAITILRDASGNSASATVEFATYEDVLAAKTRNKKELDGREVHISGGGQSTLYVTNYPAAYSEEDIRELFASFGEIASVRFPSLKFNTRRRFCYVTFLEPAMAKAAEDSMDGKLLDNVHRLVAKISNPDAKKKRDGAQAEGREVFVKNIDFTTSDDDLKAFFSQYGEVTRTNLLRNVKGRLVGTGFVIFSSPEEANKALSADRKPFKDRILHVELSTTKGGAPSWEKARKTDVIVKHSGNDAHENGSERRGSDVSMASDSTGYNGEDSFKTVRERSVAILNLPDTVNDARITAFMEQYGRIVKIQLRRRDEGAIVEFAEVKDAAKIRLGIDCGALGPHTKIGDVSELLNKHKGTMAAPKPVYDLKPSFVSRPGQGRGGRRGGLGFKRGGSSSAGRGNASAGSTGQAEGETAAKSNADFRILFKKAAEEESDN